MLCLFWSVVKINTAPFEPNVIHGEPQWFRCWWGFSTGLRFRGEFSQQVREIIGLIFITDERHVRCFQEHVTDNWRALQKGGSFKVEGQFVKGQKRSLTNTI